jgi:hypothetical protein
LIGGRFRLIKYIQSGTFKHGWKALDIQRRVGGEFPVVFLATLKTKEDTVGGKTISSLALQVGFTPSVLARLEAAADGRSGRDCVGIRRGPWPLLHS